MQIYAIVLATFVILVSSCFHEKNTDELAQMQQDKMDCSLSVFTKASAQSTLIFPMHIFAFGDDGQLVSKLIVHSAEDEIRLALSSDNQFHIVVVAAEEDRYSLPDNPTYSSVINIVNGFARELEKQTPDNESTASLMMGEAVVFTTKQTASVHILLHHVLTAMCFDLYKMPAAVSGVSLTIDAPASGITLAGNYKGSNAVCIPCREVKIEGEDAFWTSDLLYFFPTQGDRTNFTVSYTDNSGLHHSSATYRGTLQAATPYHISATFQDGIPISLTGTVSPGEWNSIQKLTFGVGEGLTSDVTTDDGNTPSIDNSNTIDVNQLPQLYSLWENHIVMAFLNSDGIAFDQEHLAEATEVSALLLALSDFEDVPSAYASKDQNLWETLCNNYCEYELAEWKLPTEEQARILAKAYIENSKQIDDLIAGCPGAANIVTSTGSKNVRYLCDNGFKTFSMGKNLVMTAGATVKYRVRPVNTVRMKVVTK